MTTEYDNTDQFSWDEPEEETPDHHLRSDDFNGMRIDKAFNILVEAFNTQSDNIVSLKTSIFLLTNEVEKLKPKKPKKSEKKYI